MHGCIAKDNGDVEKNMEKIKKKNKVALTVMPSPDTRDLLPRRTLGLNPSRGESLLLTYFNKQYVLNN